MHLTVMNSLRPIQRRGVNFETGCVRLAHWAISWIAILLLSMTLSAVLCINSVLIFPYLVASPTWSPPLYLPLSAPPFLFSFQLQSGDGSSMAMLANCLVSIGHAVTRHSAERTQHLLQQYFGTLCYIRDASRSPHCNSKYATITTVISTRRSLKLISFQGAFCSFCLHLGLSILYAIYSTSAHFKCWSDKFFTTKVGVG